MHFTYVLKRENGDWYVGYTANLIARIKEHEVRWKSKVKLVYYEAYYSELLARSREKRLKYYGSAWRGLKRRLSA